MFLNQTAEYGLRAMAQLALLPPKELINAEALSAKTGIPRHYISKVMRRMVERDLVHAQKGHGGGFRLARPARRVRFDDILQAVGFEPHEEHCLFGWPQCGLGNPCPLHHVWANMTDTFSEWARQTTLADVRDGAPMHQLAENSQPG